jgi:hypothetical protein
LVDSRLFPFDVFRRVSAKQLRGLERRPARFKSPQGNQGNYHLRDAIIKHIALTRAVVCQPENLLVTSGAQQAFDLLAGSAAAGFHHRAGLGDADPGRREELPGLALLHAGSDRGCRIHRRGSFTFASGCLNNLCLGSPVSRFVIRTVLDTTSWLLVVR